jgi:hypothetical protein
MYMPKQDKPIIVSVSSDHHAGSTVGLCPNRIVLDDGDARLNSKAQRWLWRNWLFYVSKVKARAEEHDTKYIAVLDGDVIEGNHHHTAQVITQNETTQMRIAGKVLSPLLQDADQAYFLRGTPAHVGQQARLEEKVADDWTNTVKHGENSTRWHLSLDVNGTIFDIAHKGAIGRLAWTKPNSVNKIAASVILNSHEHGTKCAHVVMRAHFHQYVDTGNNFRNIRVISLPGWQLITGYVNTMSPGAIPDIGGLIFTCWPDKTYDLEVVRFFPKPTPPLKVRS